MGEVQELVANLRVDVARDVARLEGRMAAIETGWSEIKSALAEIRRAIDEGNRRTASLEQFRTGMRWTWGTIGFLAGVGSGLFVGLPAWLHFVAGK